MQIAFVRTSHPPPLIPVHHPLATPPPRWLPPIPGSCLSRSRGPLFLVVSPFLHHPLSTRISLLFSSSAPLHQPAHLRDSALRSLARSLRPATSTSPRGPKPPSISRARERASVKNVSTIVCRGVCSFIFAEGVEYQAGRGCCRRHRRRHRRASGDETSPAIFTSLSSGKRKKVREIARSAGRPRRLHPSVQPPSSLITASPSSFALYLR